jgi:hypothetical protein
MHLRFSAAAKQELPQAQGDGDAEEGKLIFSDTGEFCRSLQLDEGEAGFTSFNASIKHLYRHAGFTRC